MYKKPELDTVSPAVFWREAARRLKLVDHKMPLTESYVDDVFLGLRLQHELDSSIGTSVPILTRFLVLFDDELYRLLLAYAEHQLDDDQKRVVEQLGEAFPEFYCMIEHLTSRDLIADDPPREDVMELVRHGALIDIDDDDEAIAEERLIRRQSHRSGAYVVTAMANQVILSDRLDHDPAIRCSSRVI